MCKDIAEALGCERPDNAIRNHVDDEDKLMHQISVLGQNRQMYIINEFGLYSLIFSSKLDSAKRFKHWVTSVVLPELRKTGTYSMPGADVTVPNIRINQKTERLLYAPLRIKFKIVILPLLYPFRQLHYPITQYIPNQ